MKRKKKEPDLQSASKNEIVLEIGDIMEYLGIDPDKRIQFLKELDERKKTVKNNA
ncbi:MAG: hypothetical protein K0R28_107 [Paenibacillus sp.]|jgi:hypothetical protein|nr:hypothetical protein [Paenibacillus sp.]